MDSGGVGRGAGGELGAAGLMLPVHGHTTDFSEPVTSTETERPPVERAGAEVAIAVTGRARVHDEVLKAT